MSAWLVSQDHINVMVTFAQDNDVQLHPGNEPEHLFKLLTEENLRSLRRRYPGRDFLQEWEDAASAYQYKRVENIPALIRRRFNARNKACDGRFGKLPPNSLTALATQIVKACDCYDYQACEPDDYHETPAAAFVERLRQKAIELGGFKEGKLYDQMPWGID